ncbi:MAG TPA: tripartite tricarboxylate transporter substrate-binding protein [Xanthobacteraceae bacterium]|jgi:tripartite-type tricarboxylate transporter receptor subunit TctC
MKTRLVIAAAAAMLLNAPSGFAADYPTSSITLVVPFAAGGPTDTLGRMLARRMNAVLGQSVIVQNVTGAGGSLGVGRVVHAEPDGYTVSLGNWSTHVINGAIYPLDYDLISDLKPVALLPSAPQLIVARNDVPATNLKDLVAWLKGRNVNVGTAGVGSAGHVSSLLFERQTGAKFVFVHYRGAGPAMVDMVRGTLDVMFDQASNSLPHVRAGEIKAFAVTSEARLSVAPDIPTVDEAGLPNFHVSVWSGLWVPKATPNSVVARLNAAVRAALADTALQEKLIALGLDLPKPDAMSPEALARLQRAEIDKWWPIVKAARMKSE